MSNSTFRDSVCVVTGGASGLGREIGHQLAAAGATVILADIDAVGLAAAGSGKKTVRTDVTDAGSVKTLVDTVLAAHGRIDYFFNNAGIAVAGEIRDLSLDDWRGVIEVNLMGEINCIHHVYPAMIAQGSGHIVNTASGFGMAPGPLNSPYVASKFAIFGISHALAAEARDFGISVSVVCPGYIETGMLSDLRVVNADADVLRAQMPAKPVPVEKAARLILAGVAKRKRIIAFPSYVGLLAFLHRFIPPAFDRFAAGQIRDFRTIRRV